MKIISRHSAICALQMLSLAAHWCSCASNDGALRWSRYRTTDSDNETKEHSMTWETPTAINFRYGFEITLYIANR